MHDNESKIIYFNPSFKRILEFKRRTFIIDNFWIPLFKKDRPNSVSSTILVSFRKERVLKCTIALKNFPIIFKNFWGTSRNISKNKENMYINQLTILNVAFKFLSNKNIYHRASHPMSHIEIKGLEGCFKLTFKLDVKNICTFIHSSWFLEKFWWLSETRKLFSYS